MRYWLLRLLLYRHTHPVFSEKEQEEFNHLYEKAVQDGGIMSYDSSYPKYRFLQYITQTKPVLFHGSNHPEIEEFEPRRQTLFDGTYTNAVFSSADGIWPLFYAVLNRSKLAGNIRNGCIVSAGKKERFYFFSLSRETEDSFPWADGMIYILPRDSFRRAEEGKLYFDEWISEQPVKPMMRLQVSPEDFIFLSRTAWHRSTEPLFKTYALYKWRSKFIKRK
ncbi:hypothetical protein [Paenibacillus dokdonensis]|uniref:hypothetical protein n=1 Tax=Paenibacillus dokdonensis TaxID=2567944 RepID=UPI0010A8A711|nr:hypothetical protein [Paenibacillus dokdonensis]